MFIRSYSFVTSLACCISAVSLSGQVFAADFQAVQVAAPLASPATIVATREIVSVSFSGARVFTASELSQLAAKDIGRPMSLQDMKNLAAKVQSHYHKAGYRLAKVLVPQQDFAGGNLTLLVLEGWLGKVAVDGNQRTNPSMVTMALTAQQVVPEQPFTLERVERALMYVNRLSGIEATSTLRPGQVQGSTDISVSLKEAPRYRGSVEINNHGSKNTGETRVIPTLELPNLTGRGDVLSLLGLVSIDQSGVYFARLGYVRPVTARGGRVSAYIGQGNTEVGGAFNALDIRGENTSAGIGYVQDFVRSARAIHTLELWLEAQNLEQSFLGVQTFDDRIRKLRLTYGLDRSDSKGRTLLSLSMHHGLGAVLGGMKDDTLQSSRAFAGADNRFSKLSFDLARVHTVSPRLRLIPQASGQYAFDPVVSSEQWGIGGYGSVVGHAPSAFSGDSGITLSVEARAQLLKRSTQWQVVTRLNHGRVFVKKPFIGQEDSSDLSGALIGVIYAPRDNFEVRLDLAKPIGDESEDSSYVYGQARYRY